VDKFSYILFFLFFVAFSALFSLMINGLFIKFSRNLGMRNIDENAIRWNSQTKPALGGISFFINFLISISIFLMFSNPRNIFENIQFLGILLSCSVGFLIGLADDAYNTRPILKFLAQLSCGLILVFTGTYIELFDSAYLNYLITIVWVVGIMNSINMLDNMDAITTIISISIILCAIIVLTFTGQYQTIQFYLLLGVLGALLGFLFFNWNPSKMYMGDTGSQFLGVLLSAVAITCFWNAPFDSISPDPFKKVLLTLIIFLIPIVDTTTVVINRLLSGRSPFVGGKDHTTHHLSYAGFSDRQVAIIMGSISFLSCLVTFFFMNIKEWKTFHLVFFSGYVLLFFGLLFSTTRVKHKS
jgi:UDP-GlcNAc:undecaprenyl-phosphate GlcNAc-1-phosphate transferase